MRLWGMIAACALCSGCYLSHELGDDPVPRSDAGRADAGSGGFDAGPRRDAGPPPPPGCPLDEPNADIAGVTPVGEIDYRFAWAGSGNITHACFDVALHATDVHEVPSDGLPTQLWTWLRFEDDALGTHRGVTFTATRFDIDATTDRGEVTITRYEQPGTTADAMVEATIRIEDDGWDVRGSMLVPYCDSFRDPCL